MFLYLRENCNWLVGFTCTYWLLHLNENKDFNLLMKKESSGLCLMIILGHVEHNDEFGVHSDM